MKIFITGASGFIGQAAVASLLRHGHEVVGLVRSPSSAAQVAELGAEPVLGALDDLPKLTSLARSADGVIHAAFDSDAFNKGDWARMVDSFELDRASVSAMLDALEGSGKPFIYTSGANTLGNGRTTPADEAVVPTPPPWLQVRADLERHVVDAASRGIRSSVIRPSLVYGHGGNILINLMITLAREAGTGRVIGNGSNKWSFVHVDDLGELYALALAKAPAGSMLHGAIGDPIPMIDIAAAISRALGSEGRVTGWPVEEARVRFPLADAVADELQICSRRTVALLDWKAMQPSVIEDLERGSYGLVKVSAVTA